MLYLLCRSNLQYYIYSEMWFESTVVSLLVVARGCCLWVSWISSRIPCAYVMNIKWWEKLLWFHNCASYFCMGLTSSMRTLCWSTVVMICCLSQWTPLNMQCTCRSGLACYSHNETCNGLGPWWRFLSCTSLADGESALSTVWESSDWLGLFQNGNYCWGGCSTSPWKRCSRSLCRLTVGSINPSKDYRWWLPFCCCSRRIWGSCKEEDLSSPFQSLQTGTMCANMHKSLFTQ
jgi:hypothetical protein